MTRTRKQIDASKQNIRHYSDSELSLLVFNTEYLYIKRHAKGFIRYIARNFIYTRAQLAELKTDLASDLIECEKYNKQASIA